MGGTLNRRGERSNSLGRKWQTGASEVLQASAESPRLVLCLRNSRGAAAKSIPWQVTCLAPSPIAHGSLHIVHELGLRGRCNEQRAMCNVLTALASPTHTVSGPGRLWKSADRRNPRSAPCHAECRIRGPGLRFLQIL